MSLKSKYSHFFRLNIRIYNEMNNNIEKKCRVKHVRKLNGKVPFGGVESIKSCDIKTIISEISLFENRIK